MIALARIGDLSFTSPRLRGEVGLRSNPGEGDSPRVEYVESPPHPDPLPASGAREKWLNPSLRGAKRRSNPYCVMRRHGLLRGACHRAALRADPFARHDGCTLHTP